MKTYIVHFGATVEEYGTVEVEAESFEEAARLAWEQEDSIGGPHCEMKVDWNSVGDSRIVGVGEEEEWFEGDPGEEVER